MADHYGTLLGADAYFSARGISAWSAAAEAARTAALVRASSYIDGRYRSRFSGRKAGGRPQPLEWPRIDAVDASGEDIADDEVPVEVEHATYEAALRELQAPGSLSPDVVGTARVLREKVGELEVQYADATGVEDARPLVTIIDDILSGLLVSASDKPRNTVSFLARA